MADRYSTRPLPDKPFVPGVSNRADRPTAPPNRPVAVNLDALATDEDFRHGVDLFNHGFPWEAHEAWEPLWFAAPRERTERALLQGLIHAAAAVVKARAGATAAARGFVDSACEHLAITTSTVVDATALISDLTAWADDPAQPVPTIRLPSFDSGPSGPRSG
jgi:Domain of unknown function (DUF309)